MEKISYTTKSGARMFRPRASMEEVSDGLLGFCVACGAEAQGVEPDARRFECEECGERRVYGLEELAIMGLLTIEDGEE